jgi:hypothetical protein
LSTSERTRNGHETDTERTPNGHDARARLSSFGDAQQVNSPILEKNAAAAAALVLRTNGHETDTKRTPSGQTTDLREVVATQARAIESLAAELRATRTEIALLRQGGGATLAAFSEQEIEIAISERLAVMADDGKPARNVAFMRRKIRREDLEADPALVKTWGEAWARRLERREEKRRERERLDRERSERARTPLPPLPRPTAPVVRVPDTEPPEITAMRQRSFASTEEAARRALETTDEVSASRSHNPVVESSVPR